MNWNSLDALEGVIFGVLLNILYSCTFNFCYFFSVCVAVEILIFYRCFENLPFVSVFCRTAHFNVMFKTNPNITVSSQL